MRISNVRSTCTGIRNVYAAYRYRWRLAKRPSQKEAGGVLLWGEQHSRRVLQQKVVCACSRLFGTGHRDKATTGTGSCSTDIKNLRGCYNGLWRHAACLDNWCIIARKLYALCTLLGRISRKTLLKFKKKKFWTRFFSSGVFYLPYCQTQRQRPTTWCTGVHSGIKAFFSLCSIAQTVFYAIQLFLWGPVLFSHNWITMHASMCRPLQNTWLSIKDKPLLIHSNRIFLRHLRSKCLARSAVSNKQAQIGHCFHTCSFRKQTTCWLYTSGTNITALNE